jgi:hypothetical protein
MTPYWKTLVSSALIGTQNRPAALKPDGSPLGEAIHRIEANDDEELLLSAAAMVGLHQRAGRRALEPYAGQHPTQSPPEQLPECNNEAASFLDRILDGKLDNRLMLDWMAAAVAANVRVPHLLLVRLIDFVHHTATGQNNLYEGLQHVVGERGRWLSDSRDKWRFVRWEEDFEPVWNRSSTKMRQVLFRKLRERDPDAARKFFVEKKSKLRVEDRNKFLDWLWQLEPTPGDEPLLESLLDDPNPPIARAAADGLQRLPGSAYVGRMIERLAGRARIVTDAMTMPQIELDLYDELDSSMIRDQLDRERYGSLTQQETWMLHMIACVPPRLWCDWLNEPPAVLINMGASRRLLYIEGWLRAVNRHGDPEWSRALSDYLLVNPALHANYSYIIRAIPPEERDDLLIHVWRNTPTQNSTQMLLAVTQPWTKRLSREAIARYAADLENDAEAALRSLRIQLGNQVFAMDPTIFDELNHLLQPYLKAPDADKGLCQPIQTALNNLQLRGQIAAAFAR